VKPNRPAPTQRALAVRGFWLTFLPLAALTLPLYFHTSDFPKIGTYGAVYFGMLVVVSGVTILTPIVIAALCGRASNLRPAYAVLAMLGGLVVPLVTLETALRLTMNDSFQESRKWGHRKSAVLGYEAQPNHTWNAADATYTTAEFGFRTHLSDRQWSRSDGTRIFVLGGSSVFGHGLDDDQTWVHLLEEKLRQDLKDRNLNVINAGTNGHNSLQSLLRFYLRVLPLKPQVLLYYEGINDVDESVQRLDSTWLEEDVLFSDTKTSYLSKRYAHKSFYFRTLLAHVVNTRLTRKKTHVAISPPIEHGLRPEQINARNANGQRFITNVTALADMCRRHKVKLVFITFIFDDVNIPVYDRETLKYYNQRLRELAHSEGIPLIDLEKRFQPVPDKKAYFFEDHYHPSQRGAQYIAATVGAEMQRWLEK